MAANSHVLPGGFAALRESAVPTLIVGDGDLSFGAAVAHPHLTATVYEDELTCAATYPTAPANAARVHAAGGSVAYGVDARALPVSDVGLIIFNFPQAVAHRKIHESRRLLVDFFCSAAASCPAAELWVTLAAGQGGTAAETKARTLGNAWNIEDAAAAANLSVLGVSPAAIDIVDGYKPTGRRGRALGFNYEGALLHVVGRGPPLFVREWKLSIAFWLRDPVEDVLAIAREEGASAKLRDNYTCGKTGRCAQTFDLSFTSATRPLNKALAIAAAERIRQAVGAFETPRASRRTLDVEEILDVPRPFPPRHRGWALWRSWDTPRYVCSPMVDQSDLAFRLLVRRYGCHVTYTPMLHAEAFVTDPNQRRLLQLTSEDTPCVAQVAGHDPDTIRKAAACLVHAGVQALDLNLGCPQEIAAKGRYGAFLLEETDLLPSLVAALASQGTPVGCKVRLLPTLEKTIQTCRILESAGADWITVHGRTRHQKGANVGSADFRAIAEVVKSVGVPVVANGGIENLDDVDRVRAETGAAAVMSAEGLLARPDLFAPSGKSNWALAREYLELAELWPPPDFKVQKLHVYRMLFPAAGTLEERCLVEATDRHGLISLVREKTAAGNWYRRRVAPQRRDIAEVRRVWAESGSGGRLPL